MKKTFPLTHSKIHPERLVDSIRAEVNKYLKRERNKKLPEGQDFWDFDCKAGITADSAVEVHVSALSRAIGQALTDGGETVYVEVISKAAKRQKKSEQGA
ncbi:DUF6172 family protein [Coraliomargarita sp. SDUM461004]|uniref:DUF6172 family protein n=1 Tax=Thalassobacterium sedimentorum TaxID=3041258 RepID=A0ABU1AJV7_9BACT|nr:DUF6172 family protein [Coraliomargarita sp. SDUM461004]MDQ8195076.1 DUF6172 family protein [Coraliomargarita sp. SDUM461004]